MITAVIWYQSLTQNKEKHFPLVKGGDLLSETLEKIIVQRDTCIHAISSTRL